MTRNGKRFQLPEGFILHLLDEIPAAVFCKDADDGFRFVFWNRYAEKFWGLTQEQVVGKTDYDLFPHIQADFFLAKDQETMEGERTVIIPEEELHAPGGSYWLRTRKVPLVIGGRRFLLGISEDITLERKLRHDLQSQRAASASAQRTAAVGELAGAVAHEVNSPLSALLIQLEIARGRLEDTQASPPRKEMQAFLENMHRVASKIVKVTKTLYSYATYSHRASPERIDATTLARDAITFNREKLRLSDIELREDFPTVPIEVRVRPMEILQAVLNLLNNAIEAMPAEGPRWIGITTRRDGRMAEIAVTDSGRGVPPEKRDLIMQPYTGFARDNQPGLGLTVAKNIVETHGGTLSLDMAASHTRFVLRIPAAD